jgi:hypothetical protein
MQLPKSCDMIYATFKVLQLVTCGKHLFPSNVQTLNLVQHAKRNFWEDAKISFKD